MTEAEWLMANDPRPMLAFLKGKASDRKLRLFAAACCRRIWHLLTDERCQRTVEVAEQYADGNGKLNELKDACRMAFDAGMECSGNDDMRAIACMMAVSNDPHSAAVETIFYASSVPMGLGECDDPEDVVRGPELKEQAVLSRDIFGNPFRSVSIDPSWLTSTVVSLARHMYESRDFSAMLILADALQDAGSDNEEILNHCRQPGEHVRGCFVVDRLLGKE